MESVKQDIVVKGDVVNLEEIDKILKYSSTASDDIRIADLFRLLFKILISIKNYDQRKQAVFSFIHKFFPKIVDETVVKRIEKLILQYFSIRKEFFSQFSDYLAQNVNLESLDKFQFLLQLAKKQGNPSQISLCKRFVELLKKKLSSPASAVVDLKDKRWGVIFQFIDGEEWTLEREDSLQNLVQKSVKKAPESLSSFSVHTFSNLNKAIIADSFIEATTSSILRMLKSEDYEVKTYGIKLAELCCNRFSDSIFAVNFLRVLFDALQGKTPGITVVSLPQNHQKLALSAAIARFYKQLADHSLGASILRDTVELLKLSVEKERDDEFYPIYGSIINAAFDNKVPLDLLNFISAGLNNPVPSTVSITSRTAFLIGAAVLLNYKEISSEIVYILSSQLELIVKESVRKENSINYDALISFALLTKSYASSNKFTNEGLKLIKIISFYPNCIFNDALKLQLVKWLNLVKKDILLFFRHGSLKSDPSIPFTQVVLQRAVIQAVLTISSYANDSTGRREGFSLESFINSLNDSNLSEPFKAVSYCFLLSPFYELSNFASSQLYSVQTLLMTASSILHYLSSKNDNQGIDPFFGFHVEFQVQPFIHLLFQFIVASKNSNSAPELPLLLTSLFLLICSPVVSVTLSCAVERFERLWKRHGAFQLILELHVEEIARILFLCCTGANVHNRKCAITAQIAISRSSGELISKRFVASVSKYAHSSMQHSLVFRLEKQDLDLLRNHEDTIERHLLAVSESNEDSASIQPSERKESSKKPAVDGGNWAEKVRKEKSARSERTAVTNLTNTASALRRELEERHDRIKQSINQALFTLEYFNSLQFYGLQLVQEAFSILLRDNLLLEIFKVEPLRDKAFEYVLPVVKQLLPSSIQDTAMELVGTWRMAGEIQSNEIPMCYQSCISRFENYQHTDTKAVINSLLFIFLLPATTGVCKYGEKGLAESGFHIIKNLFSGLSLAANNDQQGSHDLVRPNLCWVIETALCLVARFSGDEFGISDFILETFLELQQLRLEELKLLCSASGIVSDNKEVQEFTAELLYGLATIGGIELLGVDNYVDSILWISQYSQFDRVCALLKDLWIKKQITTQAFDQICSWLEDSNSNIRTAAAKSFGMGLRSCGAEIDNRLCQLIPVYHSALPARSNPNKPQEAEKAVDGKHQVKIAFKSKPKIQSEVDHYKYVRESVALALLSLSEDVDLEGPIIWTMLKFLIAQGVIDRAFDVRTVMVDAALTLIRKYGSREFEKSIEFFEQILEQEPAKDEEIVDYDNRHAASVILLGTLAQHIQQIDEVLIKIVHMLIHSLQIPSESVQRSVSECLLTICHVIKGSEFGHEIVDTLLKRLMNGKSYGDRRGAAIALAAVVKGFGLTTIRQYNLISKLKDACSTGNINSRQGALFAFEFLADRLGVLFEPYVGGITDILLLSFSHSSDHVREAAAAATKTIMSRLTPHGIKQLLNPILSTLGKDSSWKSRQEAIKMLSIIVNCAPKQISPNLSQIVSLLVKASTDAHPKIKESAKVALQEVSSVIRNPEVASVSSTLLHALADPANRTKDALEALLQLEFMHSIDPPSLALLMPILARALRDRGADLKRKSAAITGNIIAMVNDATSLSSYVPNLIVGLKDCLIDPIPDVRASGAKALGNLYNGLSDVDSGLKDMLTWLFETLQSEQSPVERSGAAQGLAEICGLCSEPQKRDALFQRVLGVETSFNPFGREGIIWFLSFLPSTLKEKFAMYLDVSMPVILEGFHDELESVREVSIRAGKVMISVLGLRFGVRITSSLIAGLYKDDYKIRLYSLQLIGELMLQLGDVKVGLSSFSEIEEIDEDGSEQLGTSKILSRIKERLGKQLLEQVLSSVYLMRSDFAISVRQNALQIWKATVSNTPRTLVECMPVLIDIIVTQLSSSSEDLRLIAGRCIGELVSKLGDRVLPEIIKPLEEGLLGKSEEARLGICTGLTEILSACSRKQAEEYILVIIRTIHFALSDDSEEISRQGAKSFMILYKLVGSVAIDQIVPVMIKDLSTTPTENFEQKLKILRGLREIVNLKPREMLEYLLPLLLVSPVSVASAEALSSVLEVAGGYSHFHFHNIISVTIHELSVCEGESELDSNHQTRFQTLKHLSTTIVSSTDNSGIHTLILELGKHIEHETSHKRRRWGCYFAEMLFQHNRKSDYNDYLPLLLKMLLSRITDSDLSVVRALKDCLAALTANVPLENLTPHIDFIKNCVASNISTAKHKVGGLTATQYGEQIILYFSIPKSLDPFLALFLYGLVNGNTQGKEISAEMIGSLSAFAQLDVLKPTLIKTMGPLIRVLGERHPSSVKAAVLSTVSIILERGGANLRAFAPQLQTTFIKCLSDPLREVRLKSGEALGQVISIHSLKVDIILSELANLVAQNDSTAIKISIFDAMNKVLLKNGEKMGISTIQKLRDSVFNHLFSEDDLIRISAAKTLSFLAAYADEVFVTDAILDLLAVGKDASRDSNTDKLFGALVGLAYILYAAGLKGQEFREEVYNFINSVNDSADGVPARTALSKSFEVLVAFPHFVGSEDRKAEFKNSAQSATHRFIHTICHLALAGESADIKINALNCVKLAAKNVYGVTSQYFNIIFPAVINNLKDIDLRVRYAAEVSFRYLCEGPQAAGTVASSVGSNVFLQYVSRTDGETKRILTDYQRRVLTITLPNETEDFCM